MYLKITMIFYSCLLIVKRDKRHCLIQYEPLSLMVNLSQANFLFVGISRSELEK